MKNLTVINSISKVYHQITFRTRSSSLGKIVILQDGRSVGKINRSSKEIFCENKDVYNQVAINVIDIINNN